MGIKVLNCCSCGETKPVDAFTKRPDRPRGYMYHCKACQVIRSRDSSNKARENYLARRRAQYKEKADILRAKAIDRYHKNKDANTARSAKWKKDNKEKVYASNNARKALKRNATPIWADLLQIKEIYKQAAAWNDIWPDDPVHVDHIVPINGKLVCGLHTQQNLQIIRATDNMRKSNRLLDIAYV